MAGLEFPMITKSSIRCRKVTLLSCMCQDVWIAPFPNASAFAIPNHLLARLALLSVVTMIFISLVLQMPMFLMNPGLQELERTVESFTFFSWMLPLL